MIKFRCKYILLLFFFSQIQLLVEAQNFTVVNKLVKVSILYDPKGTKLDSITAHLLASDIERVTSYRPFVLTDLSKANGNAILIGNTQSSYIQKLLGKESKIYKSLTGKWECFGLKIIDQPLKNIKQALVIAGSDSRGTAYGVFTVSEKIGVSPWYWWADVPVKQQKELIISQPPFISVTPSVKYRGIFINDEDWGLQPWAAKTFEPETGDIGPKTYAKVFELLLRLKANLIWPAMHPSTKAFYFYPGNKVVAADYSIIIGSSHAEPMLRNNVSEWDKSMGAFNYITNKDKVYQYWEDRVKESSVNDVIYTMGMRGVHDSGIEGVKDAKEAVPLLERIIADQRSLLEKYNHKKITAIPQVFTAYKEVLDIYDNGLKLPDDVTLVWPDDNYGYIQRLNTEKEKLRAGGSGVYYHASYWGRPHDYLWLSSTHPALIREEMMKAYETGSNRLWVLNVGDIKPLEYNIQLFMDMAYNTNPFKESNYSHTHLHSWVKKIFSADKANAITEILWKYYSLAFERRPEFMGWSQTEPTTQTNYTAYNHFYFGDEAQRRIDSYDVLEKEVKRLKEKIAKPDADAFYQLVYYPVVGASWMNKKFLYRDKASLYAKQNRSSAFDYAAMSKGFYDSIVKETNFYNNSLAGGKWKDIMSMKPRDLPVYKEPVLPEISANKSTGWNIVPEGYTTPDSLAGAAFQLPEFYKWGTNKYFIDVFLSGDEEKQWSASVSKNWISLSQAKGVLITEPGKKQTRLWVSVDWQKLPVDGKQSGQIIFSDGKKNIAVNIIAFNSTIPGLKGYKGFVEQNGLVSINASHFSSKAEKKPFAWKIVNHLGHTGDALIVVPEQMDQIKYDSTKIAQSSSFVEYHFYTFTEAAPVITIYSLPTHPVNNNFSNRYAVSVDNGLLTIIDFKTFGRSEEWKQNVLRNSAIKTFQANFLSKGKHILRIYAVDPGVILDRVVVNLGNNNKTYSVIPETKIGL